MDRDQSVAYEPDHRVAAWPRVEDPGRFPCSDCSKVFSSIEAVERHRQDKHGNRGGGRRPR
jgi:hypothetical protein